MRYARQWRRTRPGGSGYKRWFRWSGSHEFPSQGRFVESQAKKSLSGAKNGEFILDPKIKGARLIGAGFEHFIGSFDFSGAAASQVRMIQFIYNLYV